MCVLCSITIDWSTDVYSSVLLLQANYGVQLDAFLGVERTGWSYLAETDESPQPPSPQNANANVASIVHQGSVFSSALGDDAILPSITELKWAEGDPVPTNVTEWWGACNISFIYIEAWLTFLYYIWCRYADLEDCYRVLFESGMGGSSILSSLNSWWVESIPSTGLAMRMLEARFEHYCVVTSNFTYIYYIMLHSYQSGYAFVYASASSVYQIKLAQSIQGGKASRLH